MKTKLRGGKLNAHRNHFTAKFDYKEMLTIIFWIT